MRNDLSANFLATMDADHRTPIQLVVFRFPTLGNVYISDRDIVVNGVFYKGLIENWGELGTSGAEKGVSGTMEMSVVLWNGGTHPFSDYFKSEDPVNTFVDVYQTFLELVGNPEDTAVIGHFVIQDPIKYAENDMLLQLDLVTTNMRYFSQVGELLTREKYPYALERDINKSIDLIVGWCGEVNCLCNKTPARTQLNGSILLLPTRVYVQDNLTEKGFTLDGFIQIDGETMYYNWRSDDYFNVTIREYAGTIVSDHSDGSEVIQVRVNGVGPFTEYIVGQGPIAAIQGVKVKGQTPTVPYTVHPEENPAVIRFEQQPTYVEYSRGARSADVELDATSIAHNTAYQPHYAYDPAARSYGAIIDKDNPNLAIIQEDPALDDGELVKVFLNVEHWATEEYQNDICYVYVQGVAVSVGTLSKPNPEDIVTIEADVNLDHGHLHQVGGIHDHNSTDPALLTVDPQHLHDGSITGPEYRDRPKESSAVLPYTFPGSYSKGQNKTFYFPYSYSNIDKQYINITFAHNGVQEVELRVGGVFNTKVLGTWIQRFNNVSETIPVPDGTTFCQIWVKVGGIYGAILDIMELSLITQKKGGINYNVTGVSTNITASGDVSYQNVDTQAKMLKDIEDVNNLDEENRSLENIATTTSSKPILQKFDITKHLESVSWDWLQNKLVQIIYVGTANTARVVITHVYFEVEYRQRSTKITDEVTASLTGSIESRPDAVIQYLLTEKANVPTDRLGSVWRSIPIWDDSDTWTDIETWSDEGQVAGVPNGALFEEAGAWFNFKGYSIDGAIKGDLSVKDAIEKITFQTRSRLLWQNSFAKLVILRKSDNWAIAKNLPTSIIQLQSLSARRTYAEEIVNKIDLFYDLDKISDVAGQSAYKSTAFRSDPTSIAKNGERKADDLFLFDLVRTYVTAELTADYYIWLLGETRTLYNFVTYLPNFDVEKSDYVTISSTGFERLNKLPVTVRDTRRVFGSGKNYQINHIHMMGESIRHKAFLAYEEEEVVVNDSLTLSSGAFVETDSGAIVNDLLHINHGLYENEDIILAESTLLIVMFNLVDDQEFVYANDELAAHHSVELASSFTAESNLNVQQELCFGACGFGCPDGVGVQFGSQTVHLSWQEEYPQALDVLSCEIQPGVVDTVTATDDLLFSDGFGCPAGIGSGFGNVPFGDVHCSS